MKQFIMTLFIALASNGPCLFGLYNQGHQKSLKQKTTNRIVESFEDITNNVNDLCVNHAELLKTLAISLLFAYGVYFVMKRRPNCNNTTTTTTPTPNNLQPSLKNPFLIQKNHFFI